ncbi:MAG: BTAD domain-containing putative transcriptional regulator [bacterium]
MIEVSLLGSLALRRDDGREFSALPSQPKRFALLAFLAVAGGEYRRRDSIIALFWPELDQFAARRALRNTLYHLREALGDGVIVTRGDEEVAIDPQMLTSDVAAFRAAFAAGRYENVVDCYRGELLAGLHFSDAGEAFESWLAGERAQLVDLLLRALRALVDREKGAQDFGRAAYWAQRAGALAPSDEGWLRETMTLLDASNDRGGALRQYDAFARRLDAEFQARPTVETEALARRIRTGSTPAATRVQVPEKHLENPAAAEDHGVGTVRSTIGPRNRRRTLAVIAGVTLSVAAIGAVAAWLTRARGASQSAHMDRVVVSVFENRTGDSQFQLLGRMTQDWLTQGILRIQRVEVVDPRTAVMQSLASNGGAVEPVTLARRTGAAFVVSGSYYKTGDTLLFQAALTNASSGQIIRAIGPIVATTARPVSALDELRSRVMTAIAAAVDMRASEMFMISGDVPSFDAYQAYIEGYDAFWHGDGKRSEELFELAAHRDTTFAAAAVAAAMAASNYHHCAVVDSLVVRLGSGSRPLPRLDRLSLDIAVARCRGRNDEMLRLTLERADLEPRTSSFQIPAAAAALWALRPARALSILERLNPETDLGWSTDSSHFAYWSARTEALHLLAHHDEELAIATRTPTSAPLSRNWMRGRALAALHRTRELMALVDTTLTLSAETSNDIGLAPFTDGRPVYTATPGWVTLWIAKELVIHGDSAAARRVAARALDWYRSRPADERATPEERLVAAWSLSLAGNHADAERMIRELIASDTANVDYRGTLGEIAAVQHRTAVVDSVDQWLAAQRAERVGWSASYYRACDEALLGRTADAITDLRKSLAEGAWPLWVHLDPAFAALHAQRDFAALVAPRT